MRTPKDKAFPMKKRFVLASVAAVTVLSACSSVSNLWPFGGSGDKYVGRDRTPPNSTAYQCTSGKRFYVRKLEDGAVWLILPDREVRLARDSDSRYSNGITVLEFSGSEASLSEGPAASNGCKAATPG
jgi:membrane-bound inhibitor of C-type lysozyme